MAQLAKAEAAAHDGLISQLAAEVGAFSAESMGGAAEYVRDTQGRLGVVMADVDAVLAQFPAWPRVSASLPLSRFSFLHSLCPHAPAMQGRHKGIPSSGSVGETCGACVVMHAPDLWQLRHAARSRSPPVSAGYGRAAERGALCGARNPAQVKWDALREAADAYGDLREFARREKQWLLQRVRGACSVPPPHPRPVRVFPLADW